MSKAERAADLLRFWRTVEMFSPQPAPKPSRFSGDGHGWVFDLEPGDLTPWHEDHELARRRLPPRKTRIFTIFGGLYSVSGVPRELARVFGDDGKPADARPAGETAVFAFTVNSDGHVVANSATLSACAWAMSRLVAPGPRHPRWLAGFEEDENAFISALNNLSPPKLSKVGPDTEAGDDPRAGIGHAVGEHLKGAALDAVAAGAKASGTAVKSLAAGGVTSFAGPILGGIAGNVAGTFVEKLLSPPAKRQDTTKPSNRTALRSVRFDLTASALHEFVEDLAQALGIGETLRIAGIRVKCTVLSEQSADKPNEQGLLNSFIAADLARIEKETKKGNAGDALSAFLSDSDDITVTDRIDVREHRSALVAGAAPRRIPFGRWAGDPAKPLVASQQFAVNQLLAETPETAPVFAVNGPPGTGKTTMLRDVLAGIVTERGRRLASLTDPLDAFGEVAEHLQLSGNYSIPVRRLRPGLTGFEMVLATATNDAAANVTGEIPGLPAVGGLAGEALETDYFRDLATHVLGGEAWGLVAAVLGNMAHRSAFAERFWWADELGMKQVFRDAGTEPDEIPVWEEAVGRFRKAETLVATLTEERQRAADAMQDAANWRKELLAIEGALARAEADCESRRTAAARLDVSCRQAHEMLGRAERDCAEHLHRKPGFWMLLSTWFKAGPQWTKEDEALRAVRERARQDFDSLRGDLAQAQQLATEAQQRRTGLHQTLQEARANLAAALARIEEAEARWPGAVPVEDSDDATFQLSAPWADEEYLLARSRLFLEALRLHKAFLLNARRSIRGNLDAITAVLQRKGELKAEALQAAWQTLFLVVPMISTTFASLPRLFTGLGREALGWLLVDEAGQATPQQAVGGLWRCRRAVLVGDPQQLEPIVTLPLSAQQALRRHHDVAEEWLPESTSAQKVADRLARHGTWLPDPETDGDTWVGAPLRVHRRCDRPMFDISNRIAYGGKMMIHGTPQRAPFPGENAWLDVRSVDSDGKWVPAEGRALRALLRELGGQGVSPADIRVISPFLQVARESKVVARSVFDGQFARDSVGTVHTVQGQEADVVVIVLGTGRDGVGARNWVAGKPNLLNVAVSRARRRLYVIGSRANWAGLRHLRVMAEFLPARGDLS
ncbi:DNA helicase [Amycolatopsis acidicola]|uniref:DNA helicase n=1 Tax=Amycolatopsis acidicola TaxID=2596893 RepID=A0A5N0UNR3_9PSEU|nr:ATP-binding protein [Amycolatopsis acidicola]KAA9152307.1 DNA helicase [Amycolatopsis acidicola]